MIKKLKNRPVLAGLSQNVFGNIKQAIQRAGRIGEDFSVWAGDDQSIVEAVMQKTDIHGFGICVQLQFCIAERAVGTQGDIVGEGWCAFPGTANHIAQLGIAQGDVIPVLGLCQLIMTGGNDEIVGVVVGGERRFLRKKGAFCSGKRAAQSGITSNLIDMFAADTQMSIDFKA